MSKLLQKKWQERNYKKHQEKLRAARSMVDVSRPRTYPHLMMRTKKIQLEEERQAEVEMQNRILLEKISNVLRSRGTVDNWNGDYKPGSLNFDSRVRQQRRIEQENWDFARRLGEVQPEYNRRTWDEKYEHHMYLKQLWFSMTKDGVPEGMSPRAYTESPYASARKTPHSGEGYDDDFDSYHSDEDRPPQPPPKQKPAEKKPEKPKAQGVKLPSLNKKAESQGEADARELFKAAKRLAPVMDYIIKYLVRRTHAQRMQTKAKFYDLYDLDLYSELKKSISHGDVHPVLAALLKDRTEDLTVALEKLFAKSKVNPVAVTNALVSRSDSSPAQLKDAYKKRTGVDLEEDIPETSEPATAALMTALLNSNVHKHVTGVDEVTAATHAQTIYDTGNWQEASGPFLELVREGNWPQLRAVLYRLKLLSGRDVESTLQDLFSEEYAIVATAFTKAIRSPATKAAEVINQNLSPANPTLAETLVSHSDTDMPEVRRQYKRKFKADLGADLEDRCSTGKSLAILVDLANKTPRKPEPKPAVKWQKSSDKPDHRGKRVLPPLKKSQQPGEPKSSARKTDSAEKPKPATTRDQGKADGPQPQKGKAQNSNGTNVTQANAKTKQPAKQSQPPEEKPPPAKPEKTTKETEQEERQDSSERKQEEAARDTKHETDKQKDDGRKDEPQTKPAEQSRVERPAPAPADNDSKGGKPSPEHDSTSTGDRKTSGPPGETSGSIKELPSNSASHQPDQRDAEQPRSYERRPSKQSETAPKRDSVGSRDDYGNRNGVKLPSLNSFGSRSSQKRPSSSNSVKQELVSRPVESRNEKKSDTRTTEKQSDKQTSDGNRVATLEDVDGDVDFDFFDDKK